MIQANQFRVGNIVADKKRNNQWCEIGSLERYGTEKVTVHEHVSGYQYNSTLSEIAPIKLNKKIIESCGFIKQPNGLYRKKGFGKLPYPSKICVYLHQLQNLYFAITGEEIKTTL